VFEDDAHEAHAAISRRTLHLAGAPTAHLAAVCVLAAFPLVVFVADRAAGCVRAHALDTGALLLEHAVADPVGLAPDVQHPDVLLVLGASEAQSLITAFQITSAPQICATPL
jgi:hypothetical protein